MIAKFKGMMPQIGADTFVAPTADVIGDVEIGIGSSIWFQAVVRGDVHWIKIGEKTNIQDLCCLHVTNNTWPLKIGSRVTVGHSVTLHGCTIEDDCLIGMGATILDGAVIRSGSIVASNALVSPGKDFPPNSLILGSPAKVKREVTEKERYEMIELGWQHYNSYVKDYLTDFEPLQN